MATARSSKKPAQDERLDKQDFDLFRAIEAIDRKEYGWFDTLSEEQQRKFVPYMMLHWISSIRANNMIGKYYIMSTDVHANKHMFNEFVNKHPKLQWLMLCASSPGMGKQFHQWIPHLNSKLGTLRDAAKVKDVQEYFQKIYQGADSDVIKECATTYTQQQNHKYRLANILPDMKLDDIEILSTMITEGDLDEYDRQIGN